MTTMLLAAVILLAGAPRPAHSAAAAVAGPAVLARVEPDVPQAVLDAHLHGVVNVRVRVSRMGLVDSAVVLGGDPRLRASALASARWWVFAPPKSPTWTSINVAIDGRPPADPLSPDPLVMAREAERRGAPWEAIDALSGALQRLGVPQLRNEWAIRDRAVRLGRRIPDRLHVPGAFMSECIGERSRQERTLARSDHEDMVATFDRALLVCPWWADGYQWRAASLLQAGRGVDAMRTLALFRTAAEDDKMRSLANRAMAALAAGDSLGASKMLIREGKQFNLDGEDEHIAR